MDPVSIFESTVSILQATATVIGYLTDAKNAGTEREKYLQEIKDIRILLLDIQAKAGRPAKKWEDKWSETVKSLSRPLAEFKAIVDRMVSILKPATGSRRLISSLIWHFQKEELKEAFSSIERYKLLFVLAQQNDHIKLSLAIGWNVEQLKQQLNQVEITQKQQERRVRDKENQNIMDWLSPLNFWIKQNNLFHERQDGTGEWLLKVPEFNAWLDGTTSTLWCPGIPGAGKTALASFIVNYLEGTFAKDSDVGIAFIYCNYKEEDHSSVNLVGSLLQQLVHRQSIISDEVCDVYKAHIYKKTHPSLKEYSMLLQSELRAFTKVFVVIDALDECPEIDETRSTLLYEVQKLQPKLRLLITSRPQISASIERNFVDAARLDIYANPEDIKIYIEGRIKRDVRLKNNVDEDPTLKDEIIETIVNKADGMFLLAKLHVASMAWKHCVTEVREALKTLPKGLENTYNEIIDRIWGQKPDEDADLAKRILGWITHAKRQLTTTELQLALSIKPSNAAFDKNALPKAEYLVSVCAGLVTIDGETDIIRLVHYTTQEYFERIEILENRFPNARTLIATTCLTYLVSVLDEPCCDRWFLEEWLLKNQFSPYAAQFWDFHIKEAEESPEVQKAALALLEHGNKRDLMLQIEAYAISRREDISYIKCQTLLHIVAGKGLTELCRLILDGKSNDHSIRALPEIQNVPIMLAMPDAEGRTALHCAAIYGHNEVVEILLRKGADPTVLDNMGRTALQRAAWNGHEEVVEIFLQATGTDRLARNDWWVALHWAAWNGHDKVAEILLRAMVKIDHDWMALHWAAKKGYDKLTEFLLREGADVEMKDMGGRAELHWAAIYGADKPVDILPRPMTEIETDSNDERTALQWAAKEGHDKVVNILLSGGASVATQDNNGRTGLHYAARYGHDKIVKILLQNGADVATQDNYGWTALRWAMWNEHDNVNKILLSAGAEVPSQDDDGPLPLHWAARNSHGDVFDVLNRAHADVETQDEKGWTAMHWAAAHGHTNMIQALREQGGNVSSRDCYGQTPMHKAASNGHVDTIKTLQEAGADIHAENMSGSTPILFAAASGHVEVVKVLMGMGASVLVENGYRTTPLHWAAEFGHVQVVIELIGFGVNVSAQNNSGSTPLHLAAWKGHVNVINTLKIAGANVSAKDKCGNTPMHNGAEYGHANVVKALMEAGADASEQNNSGWTPMSLAVKMGHMDVIKALEGSTVIQIPGLRTEGESMISAECRSC